MPQEYRRAESSRPGGPAHGPVPAGRTQHCAACGTDAGAKPGVHVGPRPEACSRCQAPIDFAVHCQWCETTVVTAVPSDRSAPYALAGIGLAHVPPCPGCGQEVLGPLSVHACRALGGLPCWTARPVCTLCGEGLRHESVLEWPLAVADLLDRLAEGARRVRFRDGRVEAAEQDADHLLFAHLGRPALVPVLAGVSGEREIEERYAAAFDCASPGPGAVLVHRPAHVCRQPDGAWRVEERGEIEIEALEAPLSLDLPGEEEPARLEDQELLLALSPLEEMLEDDGLVVVAEAAPVEAEPVETPVPVETVAPPAAPAVRPRAFALEPARLRLEGLTPEGTPRGAFRVIVSGDGTGEFIFRTDRPWIRLAAVGTSWPEGTHDVRFGIDVRDLAGGLHAGRILVEADGEIRWVDVEIEVVGAPLEEVEEEVAAEPPAPQAAAPEPVMEPVPEPVPLHRAIAEPETEPRGQGTPAPAPRPIEIPVAAEPARAPRPIEIPVTAEPARAPRPSPPVPLASAGPSLEPPARSRMGLFVAAAAVVGLLGAGAWWIFGARPEPAPAAVAAPTERPAVESRAAAPAVPEPEARVPAAPAPAPTIALRTAPATGAPAPPVRESRPVPPPETAAPEPPVVARAVPVPAAPVPEPSPVPQEPAPAAEVVPELPPPEPAVAEAVPEPSPEPAPAAPAVPAPPAVTPGSLWELGEVDAVPVPISRTAPRPTGIAQAAWKKGTIRLRMLVDEDGRVAQVAVAQGLSKVLDDLAKRTAQTWTYRPATKGGVPVKTWIVETMRFQ